MDCNEIADEIAELALDVAEGPARGAALAHIAACGRCRRDLADLSTVADDLLLLAREVEPPEGFEASVMKALGAPRSETAMRRRRWPVVAAAAAMAALGGAAATLVLTGEDDLGTDVAEFVGRRGNQTGQLILVDSEPAWMLCTFDEPRVQGPYDVEVVLQDGTVIDAGSFEAGKGPDSWGVALEADAEEVATVRILDPDGEVRSTAELDRA